MTHNPLAFLVIAIALFVIGVWVESLDKKPSRAGGILWGAAFIFFGILMFAFIDTVGALP